MQGKVEFVPREVWTDKKGGQHAILPALADETLVERLLENDQTAFRELVIRHTKKFYRYAWRVLQNKEDAEDVVQDCFIKLWRRPDMWHPERKAKFTTWFYQIILNSCRDRLRTRKPVADLDSTVLISTEATAEERVMQWQRQETVRSALQSLPTRQAEAVTLTLYDDMSNQDAADVMGVKIKAFESLLMRAKDGLKKYFAAKSKAEDKHEKNRI